MSDIKSEILFEGSGMDTDTDYRYTKPGDAPYRLNILMGEDGAQGVITNLKGNRVISYDLGTANTYFVLGSCYDALTRNVYYFIFSQPVDTTGSGDYEYDNRLLQFNEDDETITLIFKDTKNYFGLDPMHPLKDVFVLSGWLFFNPQTSEPKMIDILMAYNYTSCLYNLVEGYFVYDDTRVYIYGDKVSYFGGLFLALSTTLAGQNPVSHTAKWERVGDCYQNETDLGESPYYDSEFRYAFNVLRHVPVKRPVCIYATNTDHHANNVRGKLFRFSHRYKYFDNSYSRYGGFSDVTLPQYDEYYNGETPASLDVFNCIDVSVPLHSASLVKEIDIIFQESGGLWKRAKVINRQDITLLDQINYTHRFYNTDSAYEVIDDTYFNEAYDAVPRWANCQEIINKNILCYGGCTEGFDNIDKNDIDVSLTPEIEAITIDEEGVVGGRRRDNIEEDDWVVSWAANDWLTRLYFDTWYAGYGMAAGDIYVVTINEKSATYAIQAADVVSVATFTAAIDSFLETSFNLGVVYHTNAFVGIIGAINISVSTFYEPDPGVSKVALTKKRGFKTGAWHPFCIYYYDTAMRRWDAQTSKDLPIGTDAWEVLGTTVYVPLLEEYSPTPASTAYKWNINWEVNHLPPTGARWWRWGYAGNALCSYFVQYVIEKIEDSAPWTRMDITPLQTLKTTTEATWNQFPQSIIEPYAWQKGDRVRVKTEWAGVSDLGEVVGGIYDYEILKYEEDDTTPAYWIYTQDFAFGGANIGVGSIIEIYRPIKTDTAKIFYEFGEIMPIIQDVTGEWVHGCGITGTADQDTVWGTPVRGTFTAGDVYHILRTPSMSIDTIEGYFHESMWYSDFYDSDDFDKGRIGVETNFGERDLNIVRYSDQYLQNTLINGMSTFHGLNYKEFTNTYGAILRIIEIGDTLKIYQRKKPSSVLIGKTQYYDAEGNVNVQAISDRVLGSIRYSNSDYGTEFPESISRNNRYVYGYDIYNGVMWRDSANGIFPISGRYEAIDGGGDYKMETYFKQKSKELLVSGVDHIKVLTVWDERHKNLYVVFKDSIVETNNDTIIFHEPSNRWICFTDMDKTYDDGWNQILELDWWILWGFEGGIGYNFDEDTRFAVFDIGSGLGTAATIRSFPAKNDLLLAVLIPSIRVDATYYPEILAMKLETLVPGVIISYVAASNENPAIAYDCDTIGEVTALGTSTVTGYSLLDGVSQLVTLQIASIKDHTTGLDISWLHVTNQYGVDWNIGQLLVNSAVPVNQSATLYFFSTLGGNVGAARQADVVIQGNRGELETIAVHQSASPLPVTCAISVKYGDANLGLTFSSGIATANNTIISIGFIPTHAVYTTPGYVYTVYYSMFLTRTGTYDKEFTGSGQWSDINNLVLNNKQALSIITPLGGDYIYIYLSVDIVSYVTPTVDYPGMTLATAINPSIIISGLTIGTTPLTFAYDDSLEDMGYVWGAKAQSDVITALPHGAKITSITDWLRVANNAGTEIYVGSTVDNTGVGETIKICPYSTNISGARSGLIRFTVDTYGDTAVIVVYQNPAPTVFDGDVYESSTTTAGFQLLGAGHAYCTNATNDLNLIFGTFDPTKGTGVAYTMYYSVWVKYVGLSYYQRLDWGYIAGCVNYGTTNINLNLSNTVSVADTVEVWLSNTVNYSRS